MQRFNAVPQTDAWVRNAGVFYPVFAVFLTDASLSWSEIHFHLDLKETAYLCLEDMTTKYDRIKGEPEIKNNKWQNATPGGQI